MSDLSLGKLIQPNETPNRDAIHVAVSPATAGEFLAPGNHVSILFGQAKKSLTSIGIVDPYLRQDVKPGERFWLFLYPKTVTNLRHHWTHPAFPDEDTQSAASVSERWIRAFADRMNLGYNDLMDGAAEWIERREYLCRGGLLESQSVPDEFWTHYEAVTGKKGDGSFFTCSC